MRFSAAMTAERWLPGQIASRITPLLRRVDAVLFSPDERSEAGRMSLIAFAVRIVSAAIAFVSQVLLARWMGGFEYGIFVLVWVSMVIVGSLSCFGFHTSVIRFIPEYREKGMLAELRGVLFASRLFVLIASTVIAASGMAGVWFFSGRIESYYVVPFFLGMFCLPMLALSDVLQGLARANSWAFSALVPTYIVRPVLILVFMAAALLAGFAPTAETAVLASIAATYVTTIAQFARVASRADKRVPAGPRSIQLNYWLKISLPIFLVESFFFLLTNADVLMVGFYMEPDRVAVYFATVKTLALVHFVYFAVKAGVAQRYAQIAHGEPEKLAGFARETVSWTFWPSLAMGLLVLLLGEPLLGMFGPGFDAGYPLLFLLVAAVVARSAVGPCESLLTMSGHQNVCAMVYAATLALNIGLNVALIPTLGLWGAAIATSAAMIFEATALSFTVWRKLGIVMVLFIPVRSAMEKA
ncbi:lipopolysaccharide biosynthesis protein [Aminobacter aganoensis]|uniref:O-antigen/teichoic acid export membrane protein n=1 Tax=Aminobacter aganoensis TaxID=83264 RepID=A0A7X0KNW3_9HYPH|nr:MULTISPECIES: lipopolysaccharide biosynthesis protein [Aminobacter]KQU72737.1 multi antimicrobial extrusion protein MatE [Aminobacter sp. DSM 101952]MBB6357597.1 O-antigen/teichoic acid export membrane protein [Aminobacter aganoensis]